MGIEFGCHVVFNLNARQDEIPLTSRPNQIYYPTTHFHPIEKSMKPGVTNESRWCVMQMHRSDDNPLVLNPKPET